MYACCKTRCPLEFSPEKHDPLVPSPSHRHEDFVTKPYLSGSGELADRVLGPTAIESHATELSCRLYFTSLLPLHPGEHRPLTMALPSSPPLLCEDPPSSPPQLPTLSDISFTGAAGRKRLHSDYGSLSSDPLFSEDVSELDFNGDDDQPKPKKLFKGPWWDVARRPRQSLRKSMMKKESFRNVDSGVWMGSDGSDDSILSDGTKAKPAVRDEYKRQRQQPAWQNNPEAFAARVVMGCLEHGKETVDLSGIGLNAISNETLRPLHQMIKHAHDDLTLPPSEDLFAPLTPSIQLFLYGNLLATLPSELFHLTNITVLSLRNNSLNEIPSSITRLSKLAELNIAGNQLENLPWELFGMLRSTDDVCKVSLRPNPFKVPCLSVDAGSSVHANTSLPQSGADTHSSLLFRQLEERLIHGRQFLNGGDKDATPRKKRDSREQLIFLAPSRIRYLDSDSSMIRSTTAAGPDGEKAWETPVLQPQQPPTTLVSTTAPSLFELALRSAQISYDLRDVSTTLPADTPPNVVRALEEAAHGAEYGNGRCSTCTKEFVIPRAEWIEYWFHGHEYYDLSEEKILPFKRRACSWDCAQVTPVGTAFA